MQDESHYVINFLEQANECRNFPPRFDQLLVDQLIESIKADESNIYAVCQTLPTLNVECSKFACVFCLKLLRKFSEHNAIDFCDKTVLSFVRNCIKFANLEEFSLLDAVFRLLCALEKHNRKYDSEEDAVKLAISCLKNNRMSISVKRSAAEYCSLLVDKDRSFVDVSALVSILCDSEIIFGCIAEIFLHSPDILSDELAYKICQSATETSSYNFAYARGRDEKPRSLITATKWRSHRLKVTVLRFLVSDGCNEFMPILLSERNLLLGDVLPCFYHLSGSEREQLADTWIGDLGDVQKCPVEDIHDFLQLPFFSDVICDRVYDALKDRLWKSPEILKLMFQRYSEWGLRKQNEVLNLVLQNLSSSDWERRDVAIEFLRLLPEATVSECNEVIKKLRLMCLNDNNSFVRGNVLRLLDEIQDNTVLDLAVKTIQTDLFNEPRLEAVTALLHNLPSSQQECCEVLEGILKDGDIEIRQKAVSIAANLMSLGGVSAKTAKVSLTDALKTESALRHEITLLLGNDSDTTTMVDTYSGQFGDDNDGHSFTNNDDGSVKTTNKAVDLLKEALKKIHLSSNVATSDNDNEPVLDCY